MGKSFRRASVIAHRPHPSGRSMMVMVMMMVMMMMMMMMVTCHRCDGASGRFTAGQARQGMAQEGQGPGGGG
jgi:hypothetical protein